MNDTTKRQPESVRCCPVCKGTGKAEGGKECPACGGTGEIDRKRA